MHSIALWHGNAGIHANAALQHHKTVAAAAAAVVVAVLVLNTTICVKSRAMGMCVFMTLTNGVTSNVQIFKSIRTQIG